MRKIAIVGSGQAGLQLAIGLLARGYPVTVYTDRTPEEALGSRLPATSFLFDQALTYERELGLDFWADKAVSAGGVYLDLCASRGQRALTLLGRFSRPGRAIDPRLKQARWMQEFERRGGRLILQSMSLAGLDRVAPDYDLMLIAAGKGDLSRLFERDERRSQNTAPKRHLATLSVLKAKPWPGLPFTPVKFVITPGEGELVWLPFHDRLHGRCVNLLFEAVPGGAMDRFQGLTRGEEVLARAKEVMRGIAPWAEELFAEVRLLDELSWLTGAITPTVRRPVARLPSGARVMGLGDTVILNDPIAGQGANCAAKMAHFLTRRIVEHGDRPFTEHWMEETFEAFWERDGRPITTFSNLLLDPPPPGMQRVMAAGATTPAVADALVDCFNEPQRFWPWIADEGEAQAFIQRLCAA